MLLILACSQDLAETITPAVMVDAGVAAQLPVLHYQGNRGQSVQTADMILAGSITLPNHPPVAFPLNPTWRENPRNDRNWSFQLHSFRWAMALFHAWEQTRDERYLEHLLFLVDDYAEDCLLSHNAPEMTWYDMSAALRVENWLSLRRLLIKEGLFSEDQDQRYVEYARIHGEALMNTIPYLSDSNHGTFHNRALIGIGLSCPKLALAESWVQEGIDRTEDQIFTMVGTHGAYLENAPQYHFIMLKVFNSIDRLLMKAGRSLDNDIQQRMAAMPVVAAHLIKPDGSLPMIGDSPQYFPLSEKLGPGIAWMVSQGLRGHPPESKYAIHPEAGYAIGRTGWGQQREFADETWVAMDIGPKGGAHGHFDALNLLLYSHGENLLVDAGQYTFKSNDWRRVFCSPASHNVVTSLDGNRKFSGSGESHLTGTTIDSEYMFVAAESNPQPGMTWERALVFWGSDIIVRDVVDGAPIEGWRQKWRLACSSNAEQTPWGHSVSKGRAVLDLATIRSHQRLVGVESPESGWYSDGYEKKQRIPVVLIDHSQDDREVVTWFHVHSGNDALQDVIALGPNRYQVDTTSGRQIFSIDWNSGHVTLSAKQEKEH
jgi:hypothetical protein